MAFDYHAIRELRGLHRSLICAGDDDVLPMRQRILDVVASFGLDVSTAPPPPADLAAAPPHTLILWGTDEHMCVIVYAIPDAKISPELRAALAKTPFCFAGPADCGAGQWEAAVRVLAELDVLGMTPAQLHDGYSRTPPVAEIASYHCRCAGHDVADLAADELALDWVNRRYSVAYAFNLAM